MINRPNTMHSQRMMEKIFKKEKKESIEKLVNIKKHCNLNHIRNLEIHGELNSKHKLYKCFSKLIHSPIINRNDGVP